MNDTVKKLDEQINRDFRDAVNSSPTISNEPEFTQLYNLSCAVMDRLDTSVRFLNQNWEYPKTEEAFLCFMLFACMLNDGVDAVYEKTVGGEPKCNAENKHFGQYCMMEPLSIPEELCPSDEAFFEQLRALSFAHPFNTNHKKVFREIFGTQVSPWVVVNPQMSPFYKIPEAIGVRLYASVKNDNGWDLHDIMISFIALKEFLVEKYNSLQNVTNWIKNESEKTFAEWKKIRINREQNPEDILREVCAVLDSRHEGTYNVEQMLSYLECELSDLRNEEYVGKYREYLISLIPSICDNVEKLDGHGEYAIERASSVFNPLGLHRMAHYQLEKIFLYLNEKTSYVSSGSNEEFGLTMAQNFYEEFAKKWVYMDVYHMQYTEIKLLIKVALFMECEEQGRLQIR